VVGPTTTNCFKTKLRERLVVRSGRRFKAKEDIVGASVIRHFE